MRVIHSSKRSATLATPLAGIFCLVGTSIQAVDFEDIYITGGIVHWPEFGSTPGRFSFQFRTTTYERGSISDSSSQTTLKAGAGYSIDESWSVEAVATVGMEHETSIPGLFGRIYTERPVFSGDSFEDELEIGFDFGLTRKLNASILGINSVDTIGVQGDFSLFGRLELLSSNETSKLRFAPSMNCGKNPISSFRLRSKSFRSSTPRQICLRFQGSNGVRTTGALRFRFLFDLF